MTDMDVADRQKKTLLHNMKKAKEEGKENPDDEQKVIEVVKQYNTLRKQYIDI